MISRAASGMLVPGPKMAATPAFSQEVVVLRRDHAAARPPRCRRRPAPSAPRSAPAPGSCGRRPGVETPTRARRSRCAWRAPPPGSGTAGPMSTSKPRSAKAVAITLAPRSWPSWPSLTTSMRGRRPSSSAKASTSAWIAREVLVALVGRAVDAGDRPDLGPVAAEDLLQRVGDLAHRGARARRLDAQRRAGCRSPASRAAVERVERRLAPPRSSRVGADLLEPRDLRLAHRGVVDVEDVDRVLARRAGTC